MIKVNGKGVWENLKYEKLPRMCFKCGRILHDDEGCDEGALKSESMSVTNSQFGAWLRAEPLSRRKSYNGLWSGERRGR